MPDEITIDSVLRDSTFTASGSQRNCMTVRSGGNTIVGVVYVDTVGARLGRSTNGGQSFTEISIDAVVANLGIACWWDRWTPGDTTGNLLHIASADDTATTGERFTYFSYDMINNTVGGTNNVDIQTFTALTPSATSPDGQCYICKGVNGDLYASCIATTAIGLHVNKSTTGGSSWVNIDNKTVNVNTAYNQIDDRTVMVPLLTGNDIMLIGVDDSANNIGSHIYNPAGDIWSARTVINLSGLMDTNAQAETWKHMFDAFSHPTTGDVYLVMCQLTAAASPNGDILLIKFSDSTRRWHTDVNNGASTRGPIIVYNGSAVAAEGTNLYEMCAVTIEFDATNGIIMVAYVLGNQITDGTIHMKWSNDDGETWSAPYKPNITVDDIRDIFSPAIMRDTAEGWYNTWYNDDIGTSSLGSFLGANFDINNTANATMPYQIISGNVKDNAGSNVEGAEVILFQVEKDERGLGGHGGIYAPQGRALTDASGNYKVLRSSTPQSMNKYQGIARYDRADVEIFRGAPTGTTAAVGTLYAMKITGLTNGDTIVGALIRTTVGTSSNTRMKMYQDNAGVPNTLLGESGAVTTQGFVRSIKLTTPITVPSDGIVWVAWEFATAITTGMATITGLVSGTSRTVAHTFGTGPSPFGSSTAQTYGIWGNTFGNPAVDSSIGELVD